MDENAGHLPSAGSDSSEGTVSWDPLQQAFSMRGCWFNVFTADC